MTGRRAEPHLPLAPLLIRSGCDQAVSVSAQTIAWRTPLTDGRTLTKPAPITTLAELIHVDRRTATRWQRHGIPLSSAEDACDALGLHPAEVWHEQYLYAVLGDEVFDTDDGWSEVDRSWRQWRAQRDRFELFTEEWAVA